MLKVCSGNTWTWGNVDYNKLAVMVGMLIMWKSSLRGQGSMGNVNFLFSFAMDQNAL
jgi:hypothetical protein